MISRLWRGWTTPGNAPVYQELLLSRVLPGIERMGLPGYRGAQVHRRTAGDEVEFLTVLWFDGMDGVEALAGDDPDRAHVPAEARAVLARFEERVAHYEAVAGVPAPPWPDP